MEVEAAAAGAVAVPVPGAGAGVEVAPVKRRRGRPRKTEVKEGGVVPQKGDPAKPRKPRKRKGEAAAGAGMPTSVDVSLIGQQVTGVLDGTFDAGYLLSVRVGASDTVLRGVVFGPGLSVPLSRANDVAPGAKHVRREERPLSKLPIAAKPPAAKLPLVIPPARSLSLSLPPLPAASQIPPTQAVLENAAALFTNSITPPPPPPTPPVTGLVAALQQLPGGGYTPDPSTFSQSTF